MFNENDKKQICQKNQKMRKIKAKRGEKLKDDENKNKSFIDT